MLIFIIDVPLVMALSQQSHCNVHERCDGNDHDTKVRYICVNQYARMC